MGEKEFIDKMKILGWSDKAIKEQVVLHDNAIKEGIIIPYELGIVEKPIDY